MGITVSQLCQDNNKTKTAYTTPPSRKIMRTIPTTETAIMTNKILIVVMITSTVEHFLRIQSERENVVS